ncbi:hypothetical protein SteCoe_23551 [Stentor coeruleus]|uniref:DOMON domain-containing protein n=1 Tax=Stentor coeruleus TaxID=5963 RepID=A0A1R2BK27_9CILI|nr:hypothetical protein SteCoe_23551 [Stentor coeruleus]
MLKFIIALVLIAGIQGGKVCLPKGWVLEWTFPTLKEIGFKLTLDADTSANFGWVGVGFKYESEAGIAMVGADITNIIFDDTFSDRVALTNGMPDEDKKYKGTDDLYGLSSTFEDGIRTFTWVRPANSGDDKDKIYTIGKVYKLLWACGDVIDGIQMKHFTVDRDVTLLTLDAGFEGGCSTDEETPSDGEIPDMDDDSFVDLV